MKTVLLVVIIAVGLFVVYWFLLKDTSTPHTAIYGLYNKPVNTIGVKPSPLVGYHH